MILHVQIHNYLSEMIILDFRKIYLKQCKLRTKIFQYVQKKDIINILLTGDISACPMVYLYYHGSAPTKIRFEADFHIVDAVNSDWRWYFILGPYKCVGSVAGSKSDFNYKFQTICFYTCRLRIKIPYCWKEACYWPDEWFKSHLKW